MRLIDADALTDEIMERYCKECNKRKGIKNGKYRIVYEVGDAPCRACPIDDMKDELDNAPTIEPERKTGRWEDVPHKSVEHGEVIIDGKTVRCSVCRHAEKEWNKGMNFCPNCGAYMGGVEDEADRW